VRRVFASPKSAGRLYVFRRRGIGGPRVVKWTPKILFITPPGGKVKFPLAEVSEMTTKAGGIATTVHLGADHKIVSSFRAAMTAKTITVADVTNILISSPGRVLANIKLFPASSTDLDKSRATDTLGKMLLRIITKRQATPEASVWGARFGSSILSMLGNRTSAVFFCDSGTRVLALGRNTGAAIIPFTAAVGAIFSKIQTGSASPALA
jgi:hypothetical protein